MKTSIASALLCAMLGLGALPAQASGLGDSLRQASGLGGDKAAASSEGSGLGGMLGAGAGGAGALSALGLSRSEEHTSELQSQSNLVCRLLLEKKKIDVLHHQKDF